MANTGTLVCGRCGSSDLQTNHVGRLGDLAPPWCKEVDYTCRGCGNMVFTYEERGAGPTNYFQVDNGRVETIEDRREHVICPGCGDPVKDDQDAELVADHRSDKRAIVHADGCREEMLAGVPNR